MEAIKPIIDTIQHGFIAKKGTTTNLLEFTEDILNSKHNKYSTDTLVRPLTPLTTIYWSKSYQHCRHPSTFF